MLARVVDRKLQPRFEQLLIREKWYEAARYAYALAASHRARRNYIRAKRWGLICLELLKRCTLNDWGNDQSPIVLGGIDVPAPLYPRLVRQNFWWLLLKHEEEISR